MVKIVNINDIEDVILTKHDIDVADPEIEGRSNLNDFINKYCKLNDVLVIGDKIFPFNYIEVFNMRLLFISDINDVKVIKKNLEKISYSFNNTREASLEFQINNNDTPYFYHNNKYLIF